MAKKESTNPIFSNPLEAYPGLTVADLNQYLPALQKTDDIEMTLDTMPVSYTHLTLPTKA